MTDETEGPAFSITPHNVDIPGVPSASWFDWSVTLRGYTMTGMADSPRDAEREIKRAVRRMRRIKTFIELG